MDILQKSITHRGLDVLTPIRGHPIRRGKGISKKLLVDKKDDTSMVPMTYDNVDARRGRSES